MIKAILLTEDQPETTVIDKEMHDEQTESTSCQVMNKVQMIIARRKVRFKGEEIEAQDKEYRQNHNIMMKMKMTR
jgi:hypothetical protein